MQVRLTKEREEFVRRCVSSGLGSTPEDVVEAALRLFESRGSSSVPRRAVAFGLEQALSGRTAYITVDEVKRRAFRRVATE